MSGGEERGKQYSPYAKFKYWLLYQPINVPLDPVIQKQISKRSVIAMFGYMDNITDFINDYFNDYNIFKLDDTEFFLYFKKFIRYYNIKKEDLSFFKFTSVDEKIQHLHQKFPLLKKYELQLLIKKIEEENDSGVMEYLELNEYKKKKISKKELSELQKLSGKEYLALEAVNDIIEKEDNKDDLMSMLNYLKLFNKNIKVDNDRFFSDHSDIDLELLVGTEV
jgi:hypothetical protein